MTRRKPRNLSAEEKKLWSKVTETAEHVVKPQELFVEKPVTAEPRTTTANAPIPTFKIGERSKGATAVAAAPTNTSITMDKRAFLKMKRGKMSPDAKIDLHGMTQAQAHPALVSYILNAHAAGKRLVLVVTGKGKVRDDGGPIPVRTGILKHHVPHWLRQQPLSQVVLQVSEASLKHGGSGALYVYLRRIR